jgi:hypothetical protein
VTHATPARDHMPAKGSPADWEFVLIDVGLVVLLFALPHQITGDARIRFEALARLLDHGQLTAVPYSYAGPLFSAPLYYLGKLAFDPAWWCARYNSLLLLGGFVATYSLLGDATERAVLRTFFLILLAASMFPNHLTNYYAEVFTAVLVLVGIAALSARRTGLGWALLIIGVVNTPAALVGLLFVAMKQVFESRRFQPLIPVVAAGSLILIEAWIRRGNPFISGYEGNSGARTMLPYSGLPGFSYPWFFGVLSILLSFGKGIVFFAPGLLVRMANGDEQAPQRLRWCYQCWLWFLAGLILVYAKWWAWYGGSSWGPRFFLMASLPASLAIAVKLHQAPRLRLPTLLGVLAALTLSVWVGIDGAVFGQSNLGICDQNQWAQEFLCWYVPEFSALWRPFVAPTSVSPSQVLIVAFFGVAYVVLSFPVLRQIAAGLREKPLLR